MDKSITKNYNENMAFLESKKADLKQRLREVDQDIFIAHNQYIQKVWGDKLKGVEEEVEELIEHRIISPYFGGPATSAYMDILKTTSKKIFKYELNIGDVRTVLSKALHKLEGYHKDVDPSNDQG